MNKMMITLAALVLAGSPAVAGSYSGTCTTAPKEQWMTEAAVQAKVIEAGYTVKSIKVTRAGNCFEAYVTDKAVTKMHLFLHPTTANTTPSPLSICLRPPQNPPARGGRLRSRCGTPSCASFTGHSS